MRMVQYCTLRAEMAKRVSQKYEVLLLFVGGGLGIDAGWKKSELKLSPSLFDALSTRLYHSITAEN